jgi:2-keto-3-deoxy-L-rhamnonate aldolase RhmA
MQTNAMKRALERGETQVGVWINMVRNPAILRLMKSAGLDFARFDMEHASPSATVSGSRGSLTLVSGACTSRR